MSVENVKSFFKKLESDEAFRKEFMMLEKEGKETFLKAAAEKGFSFTSEDVEQTKKELKDAALSEEELDKVAGGDLGWGACIGYGFGVNLDEINNDYTEVGVCFVFGLVS